MHRHRHLKWELSDDSVFAGSGSPLPTIVSGRNKGAQEGDDLLRVRGDREQYPFEAHLVMDNENSESRSASRQCASCAVQDGCPSLQRLVIPSFHLELPGAHSFRCLLAAVHCILKMHGPSKSEPGRLLSPYTLELQAEVIDPCTLGQP